MRAQAKRIELRLGTDIRKQVVLASLAVVCGFLFSRTILFNSFMPFGFAFVAALPYSYIFAGLGGAVLGSLYPANGGFGAYYTGLCLLAAAIKFTCLCVYNRKNSVGFTIAASAGCGVFGLVAMFFSVKLGASDYIRIFAELMLSVGGSYFLNMALPIFSAAKPLSKMSYQRICAVIMSVAIMLMSIADFTILGASPSRIFAVLIILLSARYGRVTASTICAVALGFSMSVTGENLSYIIGAYALGGMLGGVLGGAGKLPCILGFLLGNTCVVIGYYGQYNLSLEFAEICVACLLFMALPRYLNRVFIEIFSPPPQLPRIDSMRKNLVMRLKFSSNALNEVSRTVDEIGKKLDEKGTPSLSAVFCRTINETCDGCGLYKHCFETQKEQTHLAFYEMTKRMKKSGRLTNGELPEYWAKRCLKPAAVAKSLFSHFEKSEAQRSATNRIAEIRSVVSNQMDGLSDMLYEMATEFNDSEQFDTENASRIDTLIRSMGICATDVCCKIDRRRRMSVEITANRQKQSVPKIELMTRISSLCGVKFQPPCVTNGTDITMISLSEKANFRVDYGISQLNCEGQKLSGDSYSCFNDGKGRFIMLLSDGMGNGPRAAVDSSFASNLMTRLIKAGFGFECALKLVNSAMIFKSTDESMATLDIAAIDLYSGQTDFYKAGTPQTIVVKGKKTGVADCNAYPAGILNEVEFDKTSTVLQKGNIVVMFSDGVTDCGDEWLEDEIVAYRHNPAQTIADHIAGRALEKRSDGHNDDITVIAAIIEDEA